MSMTRDFALPDLGEGLTEAEISTWLVAVGDTITLNQIVAEVETAKAIVELPSPYAGVVSALHCGAGDTVEVGSVVISIVDDTAAAPAAAPPAAAPPAAAPAAAAPVEEPPAEREAVLVGYGVSGAVRSRRGRRTPAATPPLNGTHPEGPSRVAAKPPVRALAKRHGLDLQSLVGTGPDGRVTRDDVHAAVAPVAPAQPPSAAEIEVVADARETREPIKGVRLHTAQAMVASAFSAPHVTEFVTIDVTPTLDLMTTLRSTKAFDGVRLTLLSLVSRAMLVALRDNPSLNSAWDEQTREIVTKHYVNLGIAAATPRGLMVPNIKDAHTMGLRDLATAVTGLAAKARDGKTQPAEMSGGTISLTNIGVFGIDAGTPILNPGEAAILCMGATREMPWAYEGQVALRSVLTLSLSFDHRLVDGEQGSKFLAQVARCLQDPHELIALA